MIKHFNQFPWLYKLLKRAFWKIQKFVHLLQEKHKTSVFNYRQANI